jgi:hypothetical protein
MSTITASLTSFAFAALVPDVVRSCVVSQPSPPPAPGEEPPSPVTFPGIYTPIAPGVTYANLPVAPTVIDTSPDQMIGCIVTVADNPQGRLDALFPSAVDGDGVIDRATNDIWVYDGTTWDNVGPTPGPTIVATTVIPPWNEIVLAVARTRTKLSITSLPYALTLLTEPDPIITKTKISARRLLKPQPVAITLEGHPPYVNETVIQPPTATTTLSSFAPEISTSFVALAPSVGLQLTALAPVAVGGGASVVLQPPSADIAVTAAVPAVTITINVSAITYSQSSVWSGSTAANNTIMTDGSFTNTGAATDLGTTSWVRMDLGSTKAVGSVIIGTATSNIPGGWTKAYTENLDVEYSLNGTSWTTAFNTGTFAVNGIYTFSVDFSARYIRIVVADEYVAISEFYALAPGQTYP